MTFTQDFGKLCCISMEITHTKKLPLTPKLSYLGGGVILEGWDCVLKEYDWWTLAAQMGAIFNDLLRRLTSAWQLFLFVAPMMQPLP